MKTLNDYKDLLNEDAIAFINRWTAQKFNTRVHFSVHYNNSNFLYVCCDYQDVFKGIQESKEGVTFLSLSLKTSGGCKSTFFGNLQHFIKNAAAKIRYTHDKKWIENNWYNYEYVRRIEKILRDRYNLRVA